jgi:predicted 3-demethylubiquinone-9 3-methyltransferase (glyoxalase superfamily)
MKLMTPCLWFDTEAEAATKFYLSVFPDSKLLSVKKSPDGDVVATTFRLRGQDFMALNGGPNFKLTPAVSFFITCKTQREIDTYWNKLKKGGKELQCGWLSDKFGLTWQIVPEQLGKLIWCKDPSQHKRVWDVMVKSVKFDLKALQRAAKGR